MKFTDFKKRGEVFKKFNIKFKIENFIERKPFVMNEVIQKKILKNLEKPRVFNSEYSICEMIISQIFEEVSEANDLPLWSHYYLESKEIDLSGIPDYLLALSEEGDEDYKKPIVCCVEAKKDDFQGGWGQASAAMVAAQTENKNNNIPIYGIVSTGKSWEFGILKEKEFTLHKESISATENFQKLLDYLNWIFCDARKNADILEELDNK